MKITAPVAGFSGVVANVGFVDGVGESDDLGALAYFRRHGYEVETAKPAAKKAEEKPAKKAAAKKA